MFNVKQAVGRIVFSQHVFDFLQKCNIHILPKHFYSPIPDTAALRQRTDVWEKKTELVGIDQNRACQLNYFKTIFPKFKDECIFPFKKTAVPYEYFCNNDSFGIAAASILHCMIRHHAPRTIIEVGGGMSTYVSARAVRMNRAQGKEAKLITIEPSPNDVLKTGFSGLDALVVKNVENVDVEFFAQLREGDILFIDTSHVSRIGGDVNYLYLEVLPRLNKGVIIHIHDIFLPKNYPREWVVGERYFWNEQYLLQAFLAFNTHFEILLCGSYISYEHPDLLRSVFPPPKELTGFYGQYITSSFWMRKVR